MARHFHLSLEVLPHKAGEVSNLQKTLVLGWRCCRTQGEQQSFAKNASAPIAAVVSDAYTPFRYEKAVVARVFAKFSTEVWEAKPTRKTGN